MIGVHIDQSLTDDMIERALASCADESLDGDIYSLHQILAQALSTNTWRSRLLNISARLIKL